MSGTVDTSAVKESWNKLVEQKGETNWVLWGFEKGTTKLEVIGEGTGGINELVEKIDNDRVQFGGLKVMGVDKQPNLTAYRLKAVFFTYIGSNVPALQRARVSFQTQAIAPVATGQAGHFGFSDKDGFTALEIGRKLIQVGGAHKPTHYDFGGGVELAIADL